MHHDIDIVDRVEGQLRAQAAPLARERDWSEVSARLSAFRQGRAVRRARLVGVVCGFLAAAAAGAGVQGVRIYILRVHSDGTTIERAISVDENSNALIEFRGPIDERESMLITPGMVGPDGVIKGVEWNAAPEEGAPEEQPPR